MKRNERCCRRKVRFGHLVSAMRAYIDMAAQHTNNHLRLYTCPECGGFHIGNSKLRYQRRMGRMSEREVISRLVRKAAV